MGHWKAVRLKTGAPLELYDLAVDPKEEHDVGGTRVDVARKIEAYLSKARTESDRWPAK